MQPAPPPYQQAPPPYAQAPYARPPQPGWGRFWLGVLAGGCGVLVLEALALLVILVALGSAISSALGGGGSTTLPGVPGGVPLPSGLPGLSQRSDPCSPQPCMAHSGVTVLVSDVERDAGPAPDGRSHVVRLNVTFVDTSGTHTITPQEIALRDSTGGMTLAGANRTTSADCSDPAVAREVEAGQRAGPYTLCYAAAGAASAPLTLVWIDPEDLAIVELKLP
jgi:hypothetical protein